MGKYILQRILQLIPVLLGLTILSFALLYLSPGDPAQKKLMAGGVAVSQEVLEETREEMGLNEPFWKQYQVWAAGVLRGDLGVSYKDGMPVAEKLGNALKNTLLLSGCTLLLAVMTAIPLGVYGAVRRNSFSDHLIRFVSFVGNSVPNFLVSVMLMYFFCIRLKWFPVIAKNSIEGLVLPVLSLTIPLACRLTEQVRAEVLEELSREYVLAVRIRGVKMRFWLFCNVLRNAMSRIFTILALSTGGLMAGSVVIETIFGWPGIGKVVMDAITARDYPVIQGFVILMAVIYVGINLLADILCRCLDPRTER